MIEVFADVCCPFTHVGLRRLVERRVALARHGAVVVRAWPLELVNGEAVPAALVAEEVDALRRQVAPDLFTGFDPTQFPDSTLPALELAAAAYRRDAEAGERVSLALRAALFEEGRDIADPGVLDSIGSVLGIVAEPIDRERVLADWQEGKRRGVQGSPHLFAQGRDAFCPTLDIRRVDGALQIDADPAALERFVELAFPPGGTMAGGAVTRG
jgi:predicted DsbA family dithiol-disulfide isomerase